MGLHQNVAVTLVALMALGTIQPPEADAQLCFYYLSSIKSSSVAVRTYYYYYRYYSYRCGWWGWSRCYGSYRVYVYYYYYYTRYDVHYIQQHYCCYGYSGANCDPICYDYCGHCSSCISPYNCACDSGWTGSSCCSDYNECYDSNGGCEQNCHNTVGGHYCSCNSGYSQSGSHCIDINECLNNNGGCSDDCHNQIGSYYCSCPTGYYLSGSTCYDTNECLSNNAGCQQTCVNQPGTYYCSCAEGYDLSSNKHNCIDHNECTNGEANCNHNCINTGGSYYCTCYSGYELDIDDETCVDTNECLSNNGDCEQTCVNVVASHYCVCGPGYHLDGNGRNCNDVNECLTDNAGCDHDCFNNIGSYTCDCKVGYLLHNDDHSCHDINECDTNNGGCDHTCVNEIGSYHCECNIGFLLDDDDHGCSDHDECGTNVHDCDTMAPATCHNTHGSFFCTCPEDGFGFRLNEDGRTCDDIDECAEKSSGCTHICNNNYGSYFCTCHDGFSLDPDEHGCTDINECEVANDCQSNCDNLIGSYSCSCDAGYQLESDQKSCVGVPCDPQLEAPDDGGIECTGDQVTGETCTLSCRPGFDLIGSDTRTCQPNNLWTGVDTICQHQFCTELDAPKNGYIATLACTSYFESECEVKCVDGYYINAAEPHISKCIVDEDTNGLYWNPQYTCQYISPCKSLPCQHGGACNELTMTSYYCNCDDTLFTGQNCETGVIYIDDLPIINIGNTINVPIVTATPDSSVSLTITVSSNAVNISQTWFTFDSNNPSSSFDISAAVPGIYSISYTLSGEDADNYETPATSVLIAIDPSLEYVENDYFLQTGNEPGILSEGCCSPGIQYQCPGGVVNAVSFSSNCAWDNIGETEFSTTGIVFAKGDGLSIPISLTGVHMTSSEDNYGGFVLPDLSNECRVCDNLDETCHYFDFTANDYIDLLKSRSLETTYLNAIDPLLPDWITVMVSDLVLTGQEKFGVDDFTSYLTTGKNIYEIPGCESLDLEPDSLFAVLSQDKNITLAVDGVSMPYAPTDENDDPICFAVNLCQGSVSPVHITVPTKARDYITSYDAINAYIASGWSITFKEFLLSDDGITFDNNDGHTQLSDSYWVGTDEWVESADVVPNFEFRANVDMQRTFWSEKLNVNMAFSGDIYHQSSPSGNNVQGVLSGDLTIWLNMTVAGKPAFMTLVSTSTAALFTMPEYTTDSSAVQSGIAISATYFKHNMDEQFQKILPLPEDEDSCPVDVFIALTEDKAIDYVRLRTNCHNARIGGYTYTGNFVHDVYISGMSSPSTPQAVPDDTVLAIFSYLDDQETQFNEFYSLLRPDSGDAAIVCTFGRNTGTVAVTIAAAHLSVLGTTFVTSLFVNSDGISYFNNELVSLYGFYDIVISGTVPVGTSWDDFMIALDGIFQDSFRNNILDYAYEYTDSIIDDSEKRIEASQEAANDAILAETEMSNILNDKLEQQNNLLAMKNAADSNLDAATQKQTDAWDAYVSELATASDDALNAVSLLKNVCMAADVASGMECLPFVGSTIMATDKEILEWGLKKKTHTEDRLTHSVRDVSKLKWGVEPQCQLITLIRGWGRTLTGQRCSYIHTYDNITEQILDAYYDSVEVERTEAAVTETNTYAYCSTFRPANVCSESVSEGAMQYANAACNVARQPVLESLTNVQDPLVQAFISLEMANRELTGADMASKAAKLAYNAHQDEYTALQTCFQYTDPNLQAHIDTVVLEESALTTLRTTLETADIRDLFSISSIALGTTVDGDTSILPIDISYNILGASRTITVSVDFSANTEIMNRAIADSILIDIGNYLQGNKKRRQAVDLTYNEIQFETRHAQLTDMNLYLEMIYTSLQNSYNEYMTAKNNITWAIAIIDNLTAIVPSSYPSVDFEYLSEMYGYDITIEDLNTQLATAVPVVNRTAGLADIKNALWSSISGLGNYYFRTWQNDMKKIHSMGHIDTVGHIRCYGVMDCFNLVHEITKDIVEDMPDTTLKQSLWSDLSAARRSLLDLVLYNTSLDHTSALETNATGMNEIIRMILKDLYWSSDIPTMMTHPETKVSVQIDDTLRIECMADSLLPVTYSFERNGFLVATGQTTGVFTTTATRYDSGIYQCFATNAVGTVESRLSYVTVYMAPWITLSPSRYETFEGDENGGFFACNATSYPAPMFEWEYSTDNLTWNAVANSKNNELIVEKPLKSKQGWYRCKVHTDGSGMVYSSPAYLSILNATFSKLSYRVSFMLNATKYEPKTEASGSGQNTSTPEPEPATPPAETVTLNYFRDQLNLAYTSVDELNVDFSTDNTVIVVHITMSASLNYSVELSFDDQVAWAYIRKQDLLNGIISLQEHVKNGTFWFETEGTYYIGAHLSANVNDPVYSCPSGYILAYSNFMCVTCSPGTFYNMIETNGVCSVCPISTYADEDGQTECTACPVRTDTFGPGATWKNECIDHCSTGYYSESGLEVCMRCPNLTYTLNFKSTQCTNCTVDDIESIPECSNFPGTKEIRGGPSVTTVILPSAIGGVIALCVVVLILVIVIVVATKKRKSSYAGHPANNPLYVPPQDVLSLVPESENKEYKIEKKAKSMEDEDNDVVNPLYMQTEKELLENAYDDLDNVKSQMDSI